MATKLQRIIELSEHETQRVTSKPSLWESFLQCAAWNYKYRFNEQILIWAQRPDATACATFEEWNDKVGRWINRGAKGIALLDYSNDSVRLRHVFDVSDTHSGRGKEAPIWHFENRHEEAVLESLENSFGEVSDNSSTASRIIGYCFHAVFDNYQDYFEDLKRSVGGGMLEDLDDFELDAFFQQALKDSVAYTALTRCGYNASDYYLPETFAQLIEFDTIATASILGSATSDISEMVLREVERTVKAQERESIHTLANPAREPHNVSKEHEINTERSTDDGNHLHSEGRSSASGLQHPDGGADTYREIWNAAQSVSQRASQRNILGPDNRGKAEQVSLGDRLDSESQSGADSERDGEVRGSERGPESYRPDEMGGLDEQSKELGGGDSDEGAYLQLGHHDFDAHSEIPYYNSPQEICELLRTSPNLKATRPQIAAFFASHPDNKDRAGYLKTVFNNEYSEFSLSNGTRVGYKTYDNALHMWKGETFLSREKEVFERWEHVAQTIDGMLLLNTYLDDSEKLLPDADEQVSFIRETEPTDGSAFSLPQAAIDYVLCYGSSVQDGKYRIYEQFQKSLSAQENIAFLKNEYGIGGRSNGIPGNGISEAHDSKGIQLSRGYIKDESYATVLLKWPVVAKRIGELISSGKYLTDEEMKHYPEYLRVREERQRAEVILGRAPEELEEREAEEAVYELQLGTVVHIGTDRLEIVSLSEDTVELRNANFPLYATEMHREEFDRKLRENPLNGHLVAYETTLPSFDESYVGFTQDLAADLFNLKTGKTILLADNDGNPTAEAKSDEDIKQHDGRFVMLKTDFDEIADYNQPEEIIEERDIPKQDEVPIGETLTIDGRQFEIESIDELTQNVSMRDITFHQSTGFPISRVEKLETVRKWLKGKEEIPSEKETVRHTSQERVNFRITDDALGEGGAKQKFAWNIEAISLLKQLETENRLATPEEQIVLSRYVGWGGIPKAFDGEDPQWSQEYTQLKSLLTDDEYTSARATVLNAHYTSPIVIKAMYAALGNMGFKTGNVLEPSCGIGNFLGLLPDEMSESKLFGVELDGITGRIAKQLYQRSDIRIQGFETTDFPDSIFDVAIGNVPFGDYGVNDKRYNKYGLHIHDYFFAKTLDKVRPGGVVAFITSKGTLDKRNSNVRKYIAQRADLIGAVRLPNNAFLKNAGTGVTADIIFLQKRDSLSNEEPDWVQVGTDERGITLNRYFIDNPDMVLGEMTEESTQYGHDTTCKPIEGSVLSEQLKDAVANIHAEITEHDAPELEEGEIDRAIPADPLVRNFSFTLVDNKLYFRQDSRMLPSEVSVTAQNRIKGMIALRDCVRELIKYQTEDYSEYDIEQAQRRLNHLYDRFTEKYGIINSRANSAAFSDDSSYSLLCSLEVIDSNGDFERKADMFSRRTIRCRSTVTSVDTAAEALMLSLSERAVVDLPYMANVCGKSEEQLVDELRGIIFRDIVCAEKSDDIPTAFVDLSSFPYVTADEYLSGNVRKKLLMAQAMKDALPDEQKPLVEQNIVSLEAVQPADLTAAEVSVRLGSTWIPPEIVQRFMFELLQTPRYSQYRVRVHYSKYTAAWNVEGKSFDSTNIAAYSTYGTSRASAYRLIEDTLNLKDTKIFDRTTDEYGNEISVLNKKETAMAQQKQDAIKQAFQDWIWADQRRREILLRIYNEKFNSTRPREYDGSHLSFPGMNPEITLKPHQVNAVARMLYGGNTLLGHVVGAGKTFEMIAAAMEQKQLGLCNKPLFVVPNHLTEQWAAEFLQLYPAANILVATRKDFERHNRRKFCGRIATGEYDAVIIGHSQFEKIPMSLARQRSVIETQIEEISNGIAETKRMSGERFTVKQLEKTRRSLSLKLEKLNDQSRKDDVVTFEELGVDRLFVDEAHFYKNLYIVTKMSNVAGISTTEAQKSSDLFMKCRYMDELTGGKGVVFATGTPVSNSMTELYTMQRYLQYGALQEQGLEHFDAWASTFGETVSAIELKPEGYNFFGR